MAFLESDRPGVRGADDRLGDKAPTILRRALAYCSPRYADIRRVENVRQVRRDADVFKTAMLALFRRATDDQINRAIGELERLATERG